MNRAPLQSRQPGRRFVTGLGSSAPEKISEFGRRTVRRGGAEALPVEEEQHRDLRLAKPGDALEYRPIDGLEVARGTADDAKHLRGRGLPLQRLLGLVEQPHVLDRDHGLVGEGLEQVDLALWRLAGLRPVDADDAHRHAVLQHRRADHAPPAAGLGDRRASRTADRTRRLRSQASFAPGSPARRWSARRPASGTGRAPAR